MYAWCPKHQHEVINPLVTAWKRKNDSSPLSRGNAFFLFHACVISFSCQGLLGVSANLIVFFLFIYFFLFKFNFKFFYQFIRSLQTQRPFVRDTPRNWQFFLIKNKCNPQFLLCFRRSKINSTKYVKRFVRLLAG